MAVLLRESERKEFILLKMQSSFCTTAPLVRWGFTLHTVWSGSWSRWLMKYRWCTAQARYFLSEGSWTQSEQLVQRYRRLKKKKIESWNESFFHRTPLKAYSSEDGSCQRSLSLTKNASSVDSMKENYCDAKQARRINEHAQNVKKALQMQQSSSSDLW